MKNYYSWLIIALATSGILPLTGKENSEHPMTAIYAIAEKIKNDKTDGNRTKKAQELAEMVRLESAEVIPGELIKLLADLLQDRDDSVRYWAATSLGYLGPKALKTISSVFLCNENNI